MVASLGTASSRWQQYYDAAAPPPWDTSAPSSQLQMYLTTCIHLGQDNEVIFQPAVTDTSAPHVPSYHVCPQCAYFKPPAHAHVLELACGTGSSCVYMAELGFHTVGVDVIADAVATAGRHAADKGLTPEDCTFLQHDVFTLPQPFSHQCALQLVTSQLQSSTDSPLTGEQHQDQQDDCASFADLNPVTPSQVFEFAYDCQAFHVLRMVNEQQYVSLLHSSLAPQAHLMLLVGNSNEPAVGPPVLSLEDIRGAFPASHWKEVFILPTRFDRTPAYDRLAKTPLAWWVLLQRL